MPNNKSPGSDGFSVEFYKFFWKEIKLLVTNSILYGIDKGQLSIDQRRGVLALIPKKGKNTRLLKNWRPLTLLNTHYKIFAKLLAIRLKKVLFKIISADQSGYLQGRYIGNNIRNIFDVVLYAQELNLHGMIVLVDFEKAFDTVKWDFLKQCLSAFNFGPFFQSCVATLYDNISTCVTNNGYSSSFFKPQRGIRQGCPLSALLFLLVVETLSLAIKKRKSISGFKIEGIEFKISQLADDTTLFLKDTNSLNDALHLLHIFSKCSGLNVNKDKSEAIWIGASSNFRHKPCGLKWTREPVKCLGIYIGQNISEVLEKNYSEKMKTVENLLQLWSSRPLTLKGKITVIQNVIIPQVLYLCSVLHTPEKIIKRLHDLITQFVWNKKKPKVKHTTMVGCIEDGGLKLPDIRSKIKSIKIAWLQRMCNTDLLFWKHYCKSIFNIECNMIPFCKWSKGDVEKVSNDFYKQILLYWFEIYNTHVNNADDVYKQFLWNNANIKIGNKTVCYKKWIAKGVLTMADITTNSGSILPKDVFCNKFMLNVNFLDYLSITTAIPKEWCNLIKNKPKSNHDCDLKSGPIIKVKDVFTNLVKLKCKDFYWFYIDKLFVKPTSRDTWARKNGLDFDNVTWKHIYSLPNTLTMDTRLQTFQFKIIHRVFACNYNLLVWNKRNDNLCEFCDKNSVDDLFHYFIECPIMTDFWKCVYNLWKNIFGISIPLTNVEILFGILNFTSDKVVCCLNYILLTAKFYIYNCKSQCTDIVFHAYCRELKSLLETKKYIMYNNGKKEGFDSIWAPMLQYL